MSPRALRSRPDPPGFVLVGVVMFVLALTIIGLSLFSISGYEAQFLQRSLDGEQAFQSAVGGVERARYVLATTQRLESVTQNLPLENLVSASAIQVQSGQPKSSGDVDWSPGASPVAIRVTAQVNGVQRTIQGLFDPHTNRNYYTQVITTSGGIVIPAAANVDPPPAPLLPRAGTILMEDPVWDGAQPTDTSSWVHLLGERPTVILTDPVSDPDLTPYFGVHPAAAAQPAHNDSSGQYRLNGGQRNAEYFCAPSGHDPDLYYHDPWTAGAVTVWVHGLAVWEFPQGVRFEGPVVVTGPHGSAACLVIVAGPSGHPDDPEAGIWLFSGLAVDPRTSISVILVSSGKVRIEHMNDPSGQNSELPDLAIYAHGVQLTGPVTGSGRTMLLRHRSTGDLDTHYVEELAAQGALPNVTSGTVRRLALEPGSWRVSGQ